MVVRMNNDIPTYPFKKLRADEQYGLLANQNYGFESSENYGSQVSGDSFSRLPFDLVICILSCLPTISAVQTCILARYWRNMWTHINTIRLDDKGQFRMKDMIRDNGMLRGKSRINNFITSMSRVLGATDDNLTLKSFHVTCNTYNSDLVTSWILAVLMRKVQYLIVEAKARGTVVLSLASTNWSSLAKLKLSSNCNLQIPGKICFPNLKSLYISGRRSRRMFSIENVAPVKERVLLNLPVLEKLILKHCKWLNTKHVEIQAPELTKFRTHCHFNHCEIKICAAKLEKFESEGHIDNLHLINASSVNYVALWHSLESEIEKSRALKILKAIPGLKRLKLSSGMIKYFAKDHIVLQAFTQVKQLELWYWGMYDPEDMVHLLHLFPSLESLILGLGYEREFVYEKEERALPPCFASQLKEVQFTYFHQGQKDHINTLKFFLKNAKNLQKAVVYVDRRPPRMKTAEIRNLLLPFLPQSSSCKIVVALQRRSHLGMREVSD